MLSKYRLLALDLDGTTLLNSKEISINTYAAIQKAMDKGIIVIFTTGRGVSNTEEYWKRLRLDSPMVLLNGAEIWKKPGELLERHFIQSELFKKLHMIALSTNSSYWGYSVEGIMRKSDWTDEMYEQNWMKFGIRNHQVSVIQEIYETIADWDGLEITQSESNNLEISVSGITKEYGIKRVCSLLGIELDEVMAIGDSWNDFLMLQSVGLAVAMGNAKDDIKKIANWITDTNEEDGVAKAIYRYLLNED
ncbi:Cof-type HAD-IIB family hydrolase [Heyndrickxia sporothermodurans]